MKGRKQYRYHEKWSASRTEEKYQKLFSFATCLPAIRQRVSADLNKRGLPRDKVLASVVRLLESTCIRVGNETYARQNESYGLTTLRNYHVNVRKCDIRFRFKGKSGKDHEIQLTDCALASIVKRCRAEPGELLFQYTDSKGVARKVTSQDVNGYLKEISGRDVTAKDFRTWWATMLAALYLKQTGPGTSPTACKRQVNAMVKQVAQHLGNTPTICRKSYICPQVIEGYMGGRSIGRVMGKATKKPGDLLPEEKAVIRFLKVECKA